MRTYIIIWRYGGRNSTIHTDINGFMSTFSSYQNAVCEAKLIQHENKGDYNYVHFEVIRIQELDESEKQELMLPNILP